MGYFLEIVFIWIYIIYSYGKLFEIYDGKNIKLI
jgi:hypothetical protein